MLSPLPKSQSPTVTQTCIFIFSNSYDRELFSENGLLLDNEFLPVRANFPIPEQCGLFYFEVDIIDKGKKGEIGIGFCTKSASLNKMPAHGVMMDVFFGSGFGQPYGSEFMTGDTIGCLNIRNT
ncbi:5233_t:CDS:2, partial [Funneliformis geosporum]